ncbi:MAG: methylmalonyl Co-A mutase-associated GTPase MeaB [Alphaproteobacteria bacterium]|nr:methylmalonyl Co-A mutase-associated GTPase MeaB [Alphaproteobacteria bacterium]HCP01225.1 methylmalonyl Co-A mutase-associated GTPase MeaB [Rhodospirillaceae bacterium]
MAKGEQVISVLDGQDISALTDGVCAGDRRALARAITLIESTRDDHRVEAEALLENLLPHTGGASRIGISGVPGVGKSTFIEAFGQNCIAAGHKVAVLAVDPSSRRSGGSILGDKTRMEQLSRAPEAFIRPSPTAGTLGGVARRTREVMLTCEAAGFDVLLIETVGVGQSETAVADLVDMFVLLLLPGGGDELQGLKRGIMELADLLVVNKADGDMVDSAHRSAAEYTNAVRLLHPTTSEWIPPVLTCSSLENHGINKVRETIAAYCEQSRGSGALDARRSDQARRWMWGEVDEHLLAAFQRHDSVREMLASLEQQVSLAEITPSAAAKALLNAFRRS